MKTIKKYLNLTEAGKIVDNATGAQSKEKLADMLEENLTWNNEA